MTITYNTKHNNEYNYTEYELSSNENWINYLWKMDRKTNVYDGYYYQIQNNSEYGYELMKNLFMTKKINKVKDYHGSSFVAEAVSQNPEMKEKLIDFIQHYDNNYDMYIALTYLLSDENSEAHYFTNQEFKKLLNIYLQMTTNFINNQKNDLQNFNIKKQVQESISNILDSSDENDDEDEFICNNYYLKKLFKKYNLYQSLKRLVNINI